MSNYAERVAAGIAVLNENKPGWHDFINLDTLDLCSLSECVLGQVFGSYIAGTDELSISSCDELSISSHSDVNGEEVDGRRLQGDYGFDLHVGEYTSGENVGYQFKRLTDEWIRQIKALSMKPGSRIHAARYTINRDGVIEVCGGADESNAPVFEESQFFPTLDGENLMVDWMPLGGGKYIWYVLECDL